MQCCENKIYRAGNGAMPHYLAMIGKVGYLETEANDDDERKIGNTPGTWARLRWYQHR